MNAPTSERALSAPKELDIAICILALITRRPYDFESLLNEEGLPLPGTSNADSTLEPRSEEGSDPDDELDAPEDGDMNGQLDRDPRTLRNKVLDRLAEVLARYKTDPRDKEKTGLDARHVSSTMMAVDERSKRVKIFCSKNEGLDQEGSSEDTEFLDRWKFCMEGVAKKGYATTEDTQTMFDLVFDHQRPRVDYYVQRLRNALHVEEHEGLTLGHEIINPSSLVLSEAAVQQLPQLGVRTWVDEKGNTFNIRPSGSKGQVFEGSEVAVTADSLKNVLGEVDAVFQTLDQLISNKGDSKAATSGLTDVQETALIKDFICNMWTLWRSVRHQSCVATRLRRRLEGLQDGHKRYDRAVSTIRFLCRIRHSVFTFIEAATTISIFQSIERVAVPVPQASRRPKSDPTRRYSLDRVLTDRLGLTLHENGWPSRLRQDETRGHFRKIWKEKRHVHTEIQMLHAYVASVLVQGAWAAHPYIGCSRRCCMLCYCLIVSYGGFQVRGTHETVMHRWAIPAVPLSVGEGVNGNKFQAAIQRVLELVKAVLQGILAQPYPLTNNPELLAQSSAALSTAKTILDREISEMEKSQLYMRRMMTMSATAGDEGVHIMEIPDEPGFAYAAGGPLGKGRRMPLTEAELWKDNSIRSQLGLEKLDELPKWNLSVAPECRSCGRPSRLRCSACRTRYCSATCQKRDWPRHVFVCAVPKRPDDADYLLMAIRKEEHLEVGTDGTWEEADLESFLQWLFANDRLCRLYGFTKCWDVSEVINLLCLYTHLIKATGLRAVAKWGSSIGEVLRSWVLRLDEVWRRQAPPGEVCCDCLGWALSKIADDEFDMPDWEGSYAYQGIGLRLAERAFGLSPAGDDEPPFPPAESGVMRLYIILFRPFNNIPDPQTAQWMDFGFWGCRNRAEQKSLAQLYLDLAKSGASLAEIAGARDTSPPFLLKLMESKGLDTSFCRRNGIQLQLPNQEIMGVYGLIAEVSHALSGRYCPCFQPSKPRDNTTKGCLFHPKHETHLSSASDGEYGFHGANPWERWQLLNFYKHVFQHPQFDARKMQKARRHPTDKEALARYLNTLIPGFEKSIANLVLGDAMFPKLKGRLIFPNGRVHCYCVVHDTVGPPGLDWGIQWNFHKVWGKQEADMGDGAEDEGGSVR